MSPSPADWDDFEQEEELRTDVHLAIDLALDSILDNRGREITAVEEEKLTFFAIRDLNIDLSYSWYLAGGNTEVGPTPTPDTSYTPGQQFGTIQQDTPTTDRLTRLRNYFRNETFFGDYNLAKVWYTDRYTFLRDYYSKFAPEEYTDLYITSVNIREKLTNLDNLIATESQNATLGDFGGGGSNSLLESADEREIRYLISDFHMDLTATDELSQTKQVVSAGTDLIEQVLFKLTQIEGTTREQRRLLNNLSELFFYYIWKYPALLISADTATGPNEDIIRLNRLQEFERFNQQVESEISRLTDHFYEVGLLPNAQDIEAIDMDSENNIIYPE
ncbi:hypothetical protein [Halobacterium jilantaiense]|uniref:DUF8098 domain-containing protein n=1 Tax=Halobacterium jilantaiense TaxID=355548 RepID=A0A1I0NIF2_9EURY|nr:hypothetical protein [Halobacterium jilantaiense]SEW01231.1 hypothetical protein SAMN04487945_0903 [Halobacterium jilantaiense]